MVNPLLPDGSTLVWNLVVIVQVVLVIAAVVTIVISPRFTAGGKLLWIVVVLCTPLVGAVAWLTVGRRAQIRTSAP